ncbi:CBL-interacting serine/threonine-protein kinase 24-like [Aplysia californica]|uniref:CBL-interacting serine/threonine-protein kinase 24-like n=1 Tax=Aplysia californica TaxID=6500 RepID=A0ABM1A7R8_APLCA|nr:CBL-interacting serine/threonine-protein kinase 24-like [Aplysia californica]
MEMEKVDEHAAAFSALNLDRGLCIGKGTSAEVVLASSRDDVSRKCAVKIFNLVKDNRCNEWGFIKEVDVLKELRHPRIVSLVTSLGNPRHGYIVLKYYSKGGLEKSLRDLEPPQVLGYIRDIGAALEHTHSRGIFHQDIKPANVLVDEEDRAVLCDSGLSGRLKNESLPQCRYPPLERLGNSIWAGHLACFLVSYRLLDLL